MVLEGKEVTFIHRIDILEQGKTKLFQSLRFNSCHQEPNIFKS